MRLLGARFSYKPRASYSRFLPPSSIGRIRGFQSLETGSSPVGGTLYVAENRVLVVPIRPGAAHVKKWRETGKGHQAGDTAFLDRNVSRHKG